MLVATQAMVAISVLKLLSYIIMNVALLEIEVHQVVIMQILFYCLTDTLKEVFLSL